MPSVLMCLSHLCLGNDVSGGTCKVEEIRTLFSSVYESLMRHKDAPPLSEQKSMFPFLSKFIDVKAPFVPLALDVDDQSSRIDLPMRRKRSESSWEQSETPRRSSHHKRQRSRRESRSKDYEDLMPSPPYTGKAPVTVSELFSTVFIRPDSHQLI